jgi:hypothetical protein
MRRHPGSEDLATVPGDDPWRDTLLRQAVIFDLKQYLTFAVTEKRLVVVFTAERLPEVPLATLPTPFERELAIFVLFVQSPGVVVDLW